MKRGRKARGLPVPETAQLPILMTLPGFEREAFVKQILARFTFAVALLACTALTLGAGIRWS